jgi:DnaJ homolog subfamily C member 7
MGLDLDHIRSDERHYGAFLCAICQQLCGLDALVTTKCSHVFCKLCLETWLARSQRCPTCNEPVEFTGGALNTAMVAGRTIHAVPLKDSQPVAHRVLARVQVTCPLKQKHGCRWKGDYGDLQNHLVSTTAHATATHGKVCLETPAQQDADNAADDDDDDDMAEVDRSPRALAESFKEEANAKFATSNFEQARDLYTKGINVLVLETTTIATSSPSLSPSSSLLATLYANRAAAWIQLQQWREAVSDCEAALVLDPAYAKAHVRRNRAWMELGQWDDACRGLQEACAVNPKSQVLVKELLQTCAIRDEYARGLDLLLKHDYASAKAIFGALLRDTKASCVILGAAKADLGLGLTDSALRLSLQVIRGDHQSAEGYHVRGQCMYLMGDFDNGLSLLREALRLNPDGTKQTFRQCKQTKEAVHRARQAVFHRKFEEAVQAYTDSIALSDPLPGKAPLYSMLYSERAESHLRLKNYAAALKDCSMVIYARDDYEKAWLLKCKAYHGLERHEEAKNELEDLLRGWGSSSENIRKAYDYADFAVRKQKRPDYYAILGVSSLASLTEIKKQYKIKCLEYHPDRWSSNRYTEDQRAQAESNFKALGEGLEILSDDFQRQLYDEGYDPEAIRERVAAAQHAAHRRGNYHGGHGHPH